MIHAGDVGTMIGMGPHRVEELSDAVSTAIIYKKSDASSAQWPASTTVGGVAAIPRSGDIDAAGNHIGAVTNTES